MAPVIYNLATDYARFGLAKWQADILLTKKISGRRGNQPTHLIFHIQVGKTWGSLLHWLTVSASSNYMVQRDGSILIVIPEADGPWTNGDVNAPQLNEFIDVPPGFWNDPNVFSITIEAEGTPWDALTMVQLDSIEWLCRDIYRRRPKITINHTERHRSINTVDKWNCPGASDSNDYYLAMQKRLTGGTTTQYGLPITYPWLTSQAELDKGIDRMIGKVPVRACRRLWKVKTKTPRLRNAKMTTELSGMVGPYLNPGDTFPGEFVLFNGAGGFVLTEWGTRVFMGDLTESVAFS